MSIMQKTILILIVMIMCFIAGRAAFTKNRKGNFQCLAPNFSLIGDDGKEYTLSKIPTQKVVLCFYPLDDSYYCTKQFCSLADGYELLQKHHITLFGINHESPETHSAFKKKHNLPFTLLSDPSCKTIQAYRAYTPFYTKRITVLIDNGTILCILKNVRINDHVQQILEAFAIE